MLGARAGSIDIINADTDLAPYDTGTFASTGTVVAGQAVALTAAALRDNILEFASRHTGVDRADCRLDDDSVICGERTARAGRSARGRHRRPGTASRPSARPTCRRARSPSTCTASASRCIA